MTDFNNDIQFYEVPCKFKSKISTRMHIVYMLLELMLLLFCIIPYFIIKESFINGFIILCFIILVTLFFTYVWFDLGILKKSYIELNKKEMIFKYLWSKKKIAWSEIDTISIYEMNNNEYIGITKINSSKKRNLLTALSGEYYISLPVNFFRTIDKGKLYSTILYMSQNNSAEATSAIEDTNCIDVDEKHFTVLKFLFINLLSTIVYVTIIILFKLNIIVLPFIGALFTMSLLEKDKKIKLNKINSFVFSLIISLQYLLTPLIVLIITNAEYIKDYGFMQTFMDCLSDMVSNPIVYLIYYLCFIILFIIVLTSLYSFKLIRILKKPFIKKKNGFFIEKKDKIFSVYLCDYAEYNPNNEKKMIKVDPQKYLIESQGKDIFGIYLDEEIFNYLNLSYRYFYKININKTNYFCLDLGSCTKQEIPYYPLTLIVNEANEIEVIELYIG